MDTMMPANTLYRRNIYSEELLKTLYIDPGLGFIKEQDTSAAAGEKVFYLTICITLNWLFSFLFHVLHHLIELSNIHEYVNLS